MAVWMEDRNLVDQDQKQPGQGRAFYSNSSEKREIVAVSEEGGSRDGWRDGHILAAS